MQVDRQLLENTFTATVKDMASDGRGVIKAPSGHVVFVAGVWVGEQIRVQIAKDASGKRQAVLLEILQASSQRITADCRYHGHSVDNCGGCPWQFVTYRAQLDAKQARVMAQFQRLGVKHCIEPIIASPSSLRYRNRAQLKTDGCELGFVAAKTNRLIDIEDCLVLDDNNRQILSDLRAQLPKPDWAPAKTESWNTLDICAENPDQTVSFNRRLPFRQANSAQNHSLKDWLREQLKNLDRGASVLELFAGSGNLTRVIAELGFQRVVAVDAAGDGIRQLLAQAWPAVEALAADLSDSSSFERLRKIVEPEVLVLDPPRDGFRVRGDLFENQSKLRDIFYISCDLATLCRDIEFLQSRGFKVRQVQPLDMFPQTPHVEVLVHLRKRGG